MIGVMMNTARNRNAWSARLRTEPLRNRCARPIAFYPSSFIEPNSVNPEAPSAL